VVLNPLRVGRKAKIKQWKWSSYRATAGLESLPEFLTVDWVLEQFGQSRRRSQAQYRDFVREGLGRQPWEELRGQIYLGSEEFIERHTKGGEKIREVPRVQWRVVRPSLGQIFSKKGQKTIEIAYGNTGIG
jgi:hypothetical protein